LSFSVNVIFSNRKQESQLLMAGLDCHACSDRSIIHNQALSSYVSSFHIPMPSILFVCTANLYRSPLAAAFFSSKLQADQEADHWIVESAGTWTIPGQRVPVDLLKAAGGRGIDLKNHLTRQLDHDLLGRHHLVVVMEKGHREALQIEFPFIQEKVHLLSEMVDQLEYDIPDPVKSRLEMHVFVTAIFELIDRAYPNICQFAQAPQMVQPYFSHHVNFTL
jgi:protein-tyrosine phosphatase